MRREVVMPRLGETVDEVEIVSWQVGIGDSVAEGDLLLVAATDKVDTDLPSPVAGVIVEIVAELGAIVRTGAVVCVIEEGAR